ncbi:MAG: DNA polymerase III subunit delta' [Omnitrophica WOR_2 bacterium RIFCSPHIGHO2_02_FULL_68_15]|nr:MAG: DNA polymerase III subunit delta' [Omnitrophica WOR_2 bacterium RIFCSPHIGHO2_02_FULL_68_15]
MPFSDVVGHSAVVAGFRQQMMAGTVGHAHLLLGPDGVGKAFLARQMAQALLCRQPAGDGDACGRCPSCRSVAKGQHPDLRVIQVEEDATTITIEQVRELQRWLSMTPFHDGRKVALLAEAETMQEPSANALLKTLEEPPPTAVLLITAVHEGRLLPTLVSRCARWACGPLPADALREALIARGVEPGRARAIVRRADGRLGRAVSLCSPEVWARQQHWLDQWHTAVAEGALEPAFVTRPRAELEEGLELAAAWYHDLLAVQTGLDLEQLVYPDQVERLRAEAAAWPTDRLLDAVEQVYATRALLQQRVNARTAVAALIARLAPA